MAGLWGLFLLHIGQPWWPHHANREIYIAKHEIASSAKGKTFWLLGGSATWFGYDSNMMENSLECNVVNLGFHAAMPSDFLFEEITKHAKLGDVVVVSPEYELFWRKRYSTFAANELMIWKPEFFFQRNLGDKMLFLKSLSLQKMAAGIITRIAGWLGISSDLRLISVEEVIENSRLNWIDKYDGKIKAYYNYLNMDENGDYIYPEKRSWEGRDNYGLSVPREISKEINDDLSILKNWTAKNGIALFISWPSIAEDRGLDPSSAITQESLICFSRFLRNNGYNVLGEPEDFFCKSPLFYDTSYHLNKEGREHRTKKILLLLKSHLD